MIQSLKLICIFVTIIGSLTGCKTISPSSQVETIGVTMEFQEESVLRDGDQYPTYLSFSRWIKEANINFRDPTLSSQLYKVSKKVGFDFEFYLMEEFEKINLLKRDIEYGNQYSVIEWLVQEIDSYHDLIMGVLSATSQDSFYRAKTDDRLVRLVFELNKVNPTLTLRLFGGFFTSISGDQNFLDRVAKGQFDGSRGEMARRLHAFYYGDKVRQLLGGGLESEKSRFTRKIKSIFRTRLDFTTGRSHLVARLEARLAKLRYLIEVGNLPKVVKDSKEDDSFMSFAAVNSVAGFFSGADNEKEEILAEIKNKRTLRYKYDRYIEVGFGGYGASKKGGEKGLLESVTFTSRNKSPAWIYLPNPEEYEFVLEKHTFSHFSKESEIMKVIDRFECEGGIQKSGAGLIIMAESWGSAKAAKFAKEYADKCGRLAEYFIMLDGVNKNSNPPVWPYQNPIYANICVNYFQDKDFIHGGPIEGCENIDVSQDVNVEDFIISNHAMAVSHGGRLGQIFLLRSIVED